jgi:pyruvate dehydrogenase E2 component (dihydrolipoamide acetyltransferase)
MATTIIMPRFGATMEEGTINSWSVKEGDVVSKGDLLGEIAIEKLTNELLAEEDGVILKLVVAEGDTVSCGEPILIIGKAGESLDSAGVPTPTAETKKAVVPAAEPTLTDGTKTEARQPKAGEYFASAQITPKAEELAKELGVDYHYIKGTGRFGMISREDIRNAVDAGLVTAGGSSSTPISMAAETQKMTPMQAAIAKAMDGSLKSTAQTSITTDLDATDLVRVYKTQKEEFNKQNLKLTYTAIFIKVVALALVEHKLLRTVIEDNNLVTRGEINIGIAIDVPEGLVVPNIKSANTKSVEKIAAELVEMGNRAQNNTLKAEEISGGTFTISNLGMFGIKYFTPVLNTGESALLGIGALQEIPVVKDGGIFVKPIINLSLTHDHRVVNGAPAARFLQTIQKICNDSNKIFHD